MSRSALELWPSCIPEASIARPHARLLERAQLV